MPTLQHFLLTINGLRKRLLKNKNWLLILHVMKSCCCLQGVGEYLGTYFSAPNMVKRGISKNILQMQFRLFRRVDLVPIGPPI